MQIASHPTPTGDPSPSGDPTPSGDPRPSAPATPWSERALELATPCYQWLSRPRVRVTLTGVVLLLVGGLVATNSVWTLPLVLIGALMVLVAWIGHRLDGRFAVEWGEDGTQLAFRAQIKAARPALPGARPSVAGAQPEPHATAPHSGAEPPDADVVEGEAHTVEIDVSDLRALLAAAESAEGRVTRSDAVRPIR